SLAASSRMKANTSARPPSRSTRTVIALSLHATAGRPGSPAYVGISACHFSSPFSCSSRNERLPPSSARTTTFVCGSRTNVSITAPAFGCATTKYQAATPAAAAPISTRIGPSRPRRDRFAMLALAHRLAACGVRVIERLGALELGGRAFLRLHEHAATRREEHRDLAGLGLLDDTLTEARVLDALADRISETRRVGPDRFRQVGRDGRLLEALDRSLRRARGPRR